MSDSDEKNDSAEPSDNEEKPDLENMMAHTSQLAEDPEARGKRVREDDEEKD